MLTAGPPVVGMAGDSGMPGQYDDGMKRGFWTTVVLLFAAMWAGTATAQSLEERMRMAAGAYEQKDFAVAIGIWRPLATAGNAEAQTLLGAMYWSGEGVPRDHAEAAKWYLQAAEKGYARAQNNIGFMYGFGEGTPPRDDVQAYKWLSRHPAPYREERGSPRPGDQDRATLAARMTPAQVANAERLVREWKPIP